VFSEIRQIGPSGDGNTYEPLPGGVPLVDHVAAFITTAPDWKEIDPFIQKLRSSRLPTREDAENGRELTIRDSRVEDWIEANQFLKAKSEEDLDTLYPYWAADTESIDLKVTWEVYSRTKAWESFLIHIAAAVKAGKKRIEVVIAPDRCTACSVPARFFFGSSNWHFHVRLPFNYYRSQGEDRVSLKLNTQLTKEVKQLFLALGPMVGAGITEDNVEWSALIHTIWGLRFFEDMAKPVELEHLARAARINSANSSMFHINWWCLGTILPKNIASLGDKKWGRPLKEIPSGLQQYLVGNIAQTVKIAALLVLIWCIQSFPDMTVIQDAMQTTVVKFLKWSHHFVFRKLFPGITPILKDQKGHWVKPQRQSTWVEQPTVQDMINRLNPPTLEEHKLIWNTPNWPSIICGGPRSLLQARAEILNRLLSLKKLDPDLWLETHEHKIVFWKFSASSQDPAPIT
jgi:hypothetical protein